MFDIFKKRPGDVKSIRGNILQFIKDQLQKTEGGEGGNIRGLYLFIFCNEGERHLYEAAVFADAEDKFKTEEVQKIADDYAIALPADWTLELSFTAEPPVDSIRAADVDVALLISTKKKPATHKAATAYINVLNGEAEKERYEIASSSGRINIGREAKVQTADGFYRKNHIAFTTTGNQSNRSVSRQHAHIEWDAETGSFILFPDEGGIPPHNKMKVRGDSGVPVKLQTIEIGHRLQEGDQIILGESAVLEFTYNSLG